MIPIPPFTAARLLGMVADIWHTAHASSPNPRIVSTDLDGCIAWRPSRPRTVIRCLHGTAWVTMAGDPHDHVLQPGEALVLLGLGRAALQALGQTRVICSISETGKNGWRFSLTAHEYWRHDT